MGEGLGNQNLAGFDPNVEQNFWSTISLLNAGIYVIY